jgi:two-component system nitrate/nitrite sensor histidine kinase NarX
VTPLHTGHPRAATAPPVEPSSVSAAATPADDRAGRDTAQSAPPPELETVLGPMLDAIVRLAGADAGAVRALGVDGAHLEPVVAVGFSGVKSRAAVAPLAAWCGACSEARDAASECVRSGRCGHDDPLPAAVLGLACRHVVSVPLRHRDRPVGTLDLMFGAECRLPATMNPLLQAAGDLLGMTLDNVRLARENLRIRLTNERQLLANEVHDSLAQGLTYMRMRMSLLRDAIHDGDEPKAGKLWADVDDTLGNSQRRLRELITYFRSRMDPQGLLHALSETSARFLDRTGIALDFVNHAPDLNLPPERELEAYHIVQEALANICRHAHATHAKLLLARSDDGYVIAIEDDGVGLAAYPQKGDRPDSGHYGIAIMQERARRLGGTLELAACKPGTRLVLRFPADYLQPETEP